jgi:hypothetical protein
VTVRQIRDRLADQSGQALILVMLAMPLFLAVIALVTDGSNLMVHRRSNQNAVDAVALAIAQDMDSTAHLCNKNGGCLADGSDYLAKNGIDVSHLEPAWHPCDPADPADPLSPAKPTETNCFRYPYKNWSEVEVRLRTPVNGFFTSAIGLANRFDVEARAVAGAAPVTETHCVYPDPPPNPSDPACTIPGSPAETGTPNPGVPGAMAFTMSRACDAIYWTGSASGNPTLGALGTNGGLTFNGASPKRVKVLGFNQQSASNPSGCPTPPTPPATPCTATAWGDPSDPSPIQTCVKTIVDFSSSVPKNWQLTTSVPMPQATWTPSTDYPSKCVDLGPNNYTFTPASTLTIGATAGSGPPGIYCLTGTNKTLSLGSGSNNDFANFGSGEGYTFFALNGSKIHTSSNGTKLKFYWPSACGSRPTSRPTSFTCFSRTISGYDPQTLLYATNTTHDDNNCSNDAICADGSSLTLDGDVFAMSPSTFPPPNPTTTGGTIYMAGGSASAGSGFLQSWWLTFQGNNGSYTGTGFGIGASCSFDPPVDNPDQYLSNGCVKPATPDKLGQLQTTVTGSTFGLDD